MNKLLIIFFAAIAIGFTLVVQADSHQWMEAETEAWHQEQEAKKAAWKKAREWQTVSANPEERAKAAAESEAWIASHGEEIEAEEEALFHNISMEDWTGRPRHRFGISFGFATGSRTKRIHNQHQYNVCPNWPRWVDTGQPNSDNGNDWPFEDDSFYPVCDTDTFTDGGIAAHYEYNHTGYNSIGVRVVDAPVFTSLAVNYKFSAPMLLIDNVFMYPYAYAGLGLVNWKARRGGGSSDTALTWGVGIDFPTHSDFIVRFGWASSEIRGKDNPPHVLELGIIYSF